MKFAVAFKEGPSIGIYICICFGREIKKKLYNFQFIGTFTLNECLNWLTPRIYPREKCTKSKRVKTYALKKYSSNSPNVSETML